MPLVLFPLFSGSSPLRLRNQSGAPAAPSCRELDRKPGILRREAECLGVPRRGEGGGVLSVRPSVRGVSHSLLEVSEALQVKKPHVTEDGHTKPVQKGGQRPGLDLGQTGLVFGGFQKPPDWVPVLVWGAKLPFPFLLASQNKRELQSDCFAAWRREEKGWVAFGLR